MITNDQGQQGPEDSEFRQNGLTIKEWSSPSGKAFFALKQLTIQPEVLVPCRKEGCPCSGRGHLTFTKIQRIVRMR